MPGVPYYRLVKVLDINNTEQSLLMENGAICSRGYLQAIAEGDIPNHVLWSKIGYAPGMTALDYTSVEPTVKWVSGAFKHDIAPYNWSKITGTLDGHVERIIE